MEVEAAVDKMPWVRVTERGHWGLMAESPTTTSAAHTSGNSLPATLSPLAAAPPSGSSSSSSSRRPPHNTARCACDLHHPNQAPRTLMQLVSCLRQPTVSIISISTSLISCTHQKQHQQHPVAIMRAAATSTHGSSVASQHGAAHASRHNTAAWRQLLTTSTSPQSAATSSSNSSNIALTSSPRPSPPLSGQEISSTSNAYIKHCVKLRDSARYRQQQQRLLVAGSTLLQELAGGVWWTGEVPKEEEWLV